MPFPRRFPAKRAAAIDETKYLYIRVGDHWFIPIWVVVVAGRVIVRSWNDKAAGWYRAFLAQPLGTIRLGDTAIACRAVSLRSARLNRAADFAYAAKYTTPANRKYVKGFAMARRKKTTLELIPASRHPRATSH